MALRSYNPYTPSTRQLVTIDRSELWSGKPEKSLTAGLRSTGGRNHYGRVTNTPSCCCWTSRWRG